MKMDLSLNKFLYDTSIYLKNKIGVVTPYDFGCTNPDVDNTLLLQQMFDSSRRVKLDTMWITTGITINNACEIFGDGGFKHTEIAEQACIFVNSSNVSIKVKVQGNKQNGQLGIDTAPFLFNVFVDEAEVYNCSKEGVRYDSITKSGIIFSKIYNNNKAGNYKQVVVRAFSGDCSGVVVANNNDIDARQSKNSGIGIQSLHQNKITNVNVYDNTVLLGEVGDNPYSEFESESLGIELYCGYSSTFNGLIDGFNVEGNTVICTGIGTYKGKYSKKYAYGISLGGADYIGNRTTGIQNGSVVRNTIKGCQRLGLELICRNTKIERNYLEESGEISLNSNECVGGIYDVSIERNTMINCASVSGYWLIRLMSGLLMENIRVIANDINGGTGTDDAIVLIGVDPINSVFRNIKIIRNDIKNINGLYNIYLRDNTNIEGITIIDNDIIIKDELVNSKGIAIYCRTLSNLDGFDNKIKFKNISGSELVNSGYGIHQLYGDGHSNISLSNNKIDGASRGISTAGNIQSLNVIWNKFRNCSTYGLQIQNQASSVIKGGNNYYNCPTNELIAGTVNIVGTIAEKNQNLDLGKGVTSIQIQNDAITTNSTQHYLRCETGTLDYLSTITNPVDGRVIILSPNDNTGTIILKDGGNLRLKGDFIMNHNSDIIALIGNGTNMIELFRSDNGEKATGRVTLINGTKTIPVEGVTSSSNILIDVYSILGDSTNTKQYKATPNTDSVTFSALNASGGINTLDLGILIYTVL